MIFGDFGLDAAEGALLAHTTRLPDSVLQKGTQLDRQALAALREAGFSKVTAARLQPGDVQEDEAAARLAQSLSGPAITRMRAGTGRANLAASHTGLFRVDAAAVHALNALHEGITVATLPDATTVYAGAMLVTVKIIPFAIPGAALMQAETIAKQGSVLRLAPFRPLRTGLVITTLPGLKTSIVRSTIETTERRITALGGVVLPSLCVPHRKQEIAAALRSLLADGAELLLIAGASAPVDRGDAGPSAILLAGGEIDHFGMPVDPGNLVCVGHVGTIPALVLPGCARSPRLNGIDLVLARIFAGEPAGRAEIAHMGVGGLLKDFAARPSPRAKKLKPAHPVAGLVLAAGMSSRMAPHNKLLTAGPSGETMIARVVRAVLASRASPVSVVVGHQADQVANALADQPVVLVRAADYQVGLSSSLRAGVAALPANAPGVLVCLGDMPLITPALINQLLDSYDPDEGRAIVVPTHRGKRGNPVLWDRRFFPDILALRGDTGARALLMRYADHVAEVEVESAAILTDFDTPEAFAALA